VKRAVGFPNLGAFFAATALIGATAPKRRPKAPAPRPVTQADIDAIQRAELKRMRKEAKLREHGL
jgi:hypothetical protein